MAVVQSIPHWYAFMQLKRAITNRPYTATRLLAALPSMRKPERKQINTIK